jgi:hypothetical protein
MAPLHQPSRTPVLLALLIAIPLFAGCSTGPAPAPEATPWPVPTASELAGSSAVTVPMPDLGPSPTPVPLTDADRESLRLAGLDAQWQAVTMTYPNAERPAVEFNGHLDEAARAAALAPCYTESGVTYSEGKDETGTVVGVSPDITDEASAVAIYVCDAAYPRAQVAPPSPEILGYLYDYLTQFVIVCYEANGITNPPAPTREEFVTQWPNQNWFPMIESDAGTASSEAINQACPLPPR